jgi:PKD repeat protein
MYNVGLQVVIEGEAEPREFFYPIAIEVALFDAKPTSGTAPLEVTFDASNLIPDRKKIESLDWDFDGDGIYDITGDNIRPRYTFEQIGDFNVHLRVVDVNNLVENYYRTIEVISGDRPLLSAAIEATPGLSGLIPLQIRFDGGKSESVKGNITKYEWDFGDGSQIQVGRSVSHIYNTPGFYTVTLTVVEDSGREASTTVEVEAQKISKDPVAKILTDPAHDEGVLEGVIPFAVSFDASGSADPDEDIVDYEWDMGVDSVTRTGQKVEYTFEAAGTYTVTLLVRDSDDNENETTITVETEEPGVISVIDADPEDGTAPLVVNFDGSASSTFKGKIVSYEWDFGDGSAPTIRLKVRWAKR